ncbi:MAG: nucleotidyltransferase domain-containing protein [Candidatus Binatia bacterium]|nr:nucleotidyltransferase domain-containing protein [Candidatus Binatia bacterium]
MVQYNHERRQKAQVAAEACARLLKERFGVRAVYIFGSLAGQSPWHSRSDIDLAVEGLAPEQYVPALSALWQLLPEELEVDLITLENAPPELVAKIKGEVAMPEDPKAALKQEIADELVNLNRIVAESKLLLQRLPPEPTFLEVRAAGSMVHDFYSGVERVFERIAVRLGPGLPTGPGWHTLLLREMESSVTGIRPAVIDHALALRLIDYLRFRHLFRHTYGYELQWDKLSPLIEGLADTLTQLQHQLERFITALGQS